MIVENLLKWNNILYFNKIIMFKAIMATDDLGGISKNGTMPWPKNSKLGLLNLGFGFLLWYHRHAYQSVVLTSPSPATRSPFCPLTDMRPCDIIIETPSLSRLGTSDFWKYGILSMSNVVRLKMNQKYYILGIIWFETTTGTS